MKAQAATKTSAAAVFAAFAITFSPEPSAAQDAPSAKQPEMQVTVVGCVQREADYRKSHDIGAGGAVGTGIGSADEFVLVNAMKMPASNVAKDCASATGGEAYELTGKGEDAVKPFVGHWVEITGTMKEAKLAIGTAGTDQPKPTGGLDPLNRDLKLFEIDVATVHDYAAAAAVAAPAAVEQTAVNTPPPAAPTPAPAPEPRPTGTSGQREALPQTGSEMPLVGLIGALLMAGAVALHSFRAIASRRM